MFEKLRHFFRKEAQPEYREATTRYEPDFSFGLTKAQLKARYDSGETNVTVDTSFKSNRQIIVENVFTYFNLLFIVFGVLLCIVESYKNLTFLPVVVVNTVIAIVQEIRSKKVLDHLKVLNTTKTVAIRNGKQVEVKIEDLVLDDVVVFKTGDQIVADAVVLEGELQVNESLLTGESDEITKKVGDSLMSGSFIVSGKCYGRLDKVGEDSYISKLTMEAKSMKSSEQSEMMLSLNRLIKWIGIIIIPFGLVLFYQSYFMSGNSFKESIISMEAALIGMIPEGLYLLTTIALALSATRLAKRQVLLHNMKSIETLARVDVLCVDKTGTITENEMAVESFIASSVFPKRKGPSASLEEMIGDFCKSMSDDNATMLALKKYFKQSTNAVATAATPFSSVSKYSTVSFGERHYILGAPEMVLKENYPMYSSEFLIYAKEGYRVLVFGGYQGEKVENVQPLGYILLSNPIRKEARATFEYFKEQNVAIKVISGDNPVTVSNVALKAGVENAQNYVDASSLSEEDYAQALQEKTVFGRVTPEQKKKFVTILKAQRHTVAMTGDGINDILAMKEADCSIAMASGNDATIQAAQVVLLESDFSKMPSVVLEGRRVVNNIERSASLFLAKNIFSFLLSLFAVIFSLTYPLEPSQITLISLFTIGLPSFLLALEDNKKRIEGNFMLNVMEKSIPGGITDMLVVGALIICGGILNLHKSDISTAATMLLIVVGFMILYRICAPMNSFRKKIMGISIMGILVSIVLFSQLFSLSAISATALLLLGILFFAAESIFRYMCQIVEKLGDQIAEKEPTNSFLKSMLKFFS
ncbi:HAD-IC family P-type ATPase [Vagococcus entomophilus]|uniref:ATPase P n=1 Tax=Vagococcus entomophilus TaxID=1160095 RepID=A0A430AFD3_9ENTE|nr:cation-translocating P-type ATPase [Vagococcus entomophilus]RSU06431.1 ATPase P [Vagococcus entomophilus]